MLSDDDINDVLERVYGFRLERWELEEGGGLVMELSRAIESAATAPLLAEIERLTRELEEARKDAERLDYIQTMGATVEIIPGAPDFYPVHFRVGGRYRTANESIRAAIDAAIKEQSA